MTLWPGARLLQHRRRSSEIFLLQAMATCRLFSSFAAGRHCANNLQDDGFSEQQAKHILFAIADAAASKCQTPNGQFQNKMLANFGTDVKAHVTSAAWTVSTAIYGVVGTSAIFAGFGALRGSGTPYSPTSLNATRMGKDLAQQTG